jgi:hypothetical protein
VAINYNFTEDDLSHVVMRYFEDSNHEYPYQLHVSLNGNTYLPFSHPIWKILKHYTRSQWEDGWIIHWDDCIFKFKNRNHALLMKLKFDTGVDLNASNNS